MKTALLLLFPLILLFAQSVNQDISVFPFEPIRSLEEIKMKPMASHNLWVFSSGSHTLSSTLIANHTEHLQHAEMSTDQAYWTNQVYAWEMNDMKDYKDR